MKVFAKLRNVKYGAIQPFPRNSGNRSDYGFMTEISELYVVES